MAQIKRIAVWASRGRPTANALAAGYFRLRPQRGTWVLQTNPEMFSRGLRDLAGWPGDGVIAVVRSKAEIASARALKIPVDRSHPLPPTRLAPRDGRPGGHGPARPRNT